MIFLGWDSRYFDAPIVGAKGNKGDKGDDGTSADEGAWALDTYYAANSRVRHAKTGYGDSVYRCKTGQGHTSEAANEPEVGASWGDKWEIFAEGGQDGAGTGDVVGPSSSVTDDAVGFADTSGKLLKSLGSLATRITTGLSALASYTSAVTGASDYVIVRIGSDWKKMTVNDFSKKKIPVQIVAQAWKNADTSGCSAPSNIELATNKMNISAISFNYDQKRYACAAFDLPFYYDGGAIDAYITWYSTGTTSSGVRLGLQMASVGDNESYDTAFGTAVEVTDNATGTAYKRLSTSILSGIVPSGTPAGGKSLELRLYRDPTHGDDNLNEVIYITSVRLLVPINKHSEA